MSIVFNSVIVLWIYDSLEKKIIFDDKLDIATTGTREGEGYKTLILKMIENIKSSVFNNIDFVIKYLFYCTYFIQKLTFIL